MRSFALPRILLPTVAVAALVTAGCSAAPTETATGTGAGQPSTAGQADAPAVPGLVIHESNSDVAGTVARLQEGLVEAGMVAATVDHAANAASVGQDLRPTTVVIGGAPTAGTPLMLAAQPAALDLPQRYLAWQAEDGTVYLGYNSAEYLAARAGIDPTDPALDGLREGSARIAAAASGSDTPVADGAADGVPSTGYLVERESDASVAESITRYEQAFAEKDLLAVATVDHAAGAASISEQLRPTTTTFVGNPAVGTTLLQAAQTMGIDLPVRYVAYEDERGVVHVGHADIAVLADRHGATGVDETLAMVQSATDAFTGTAAGS